MPAVRWTARSDRRALTILELLITLAIVIAMAGVSFVAIEPMLRETRLDEAARSCTQHLLDARAHARLSGRPVIVFSQPGRDGRWAIEARELSIFSGRGAAEAQGDADALRIIAGALEPDEADREGEFRPGAAIPEPWSVRVLPAAIRISRAVPGGAFPGERPMWMDDTVSGAPEATTFVLAVCLPDGSVIVPGALHVIADDDRSIEIGVEPWTGRVWMHTVRGPEDDAAAAGDDEADRGVLQGVR